MSDYSVFESDDAAQSEPRLAARTAARKMEAAIDAVRKDFGRFLVGATGIDEFGDRWHYSKNDIRAAVEPYVFPNTGTMRRIQNAMKADWKLAHPYKLALEEGETPSLGSLEGPMDLGYGHPDFPESVRPQSEDDLDMPMVDKLHQQYHDDPFRKHGPELDPAAGHAGFGEFSRFGPDQWDYDAINRMTDSRQEYDRGRTSTRRYAEDRDAPIQDIDETYHPDSGNLIPEGNFSGYQDSVDQGGPEKVQRDFTPGGDSGTNREAARLVADIYTDFARSNGMRVASLDTLDRYASTGIHNADYELLQNLIVAACECDDDEEGGEEKEAPKASESDSDSDSDDDSEAPDFGGESESESQDEGSEDDDSDEDSDSEGGDEEYDFGGDEEGGDEQGAGGQQFTVPEQAPELEPQLLNEIPHDDPQGAAPVPPEVIDSLLGLPEGTIEQLLLQEVEQGQGGGDGFGGPPQGGPPPAGPEQGGAPQGGGEDFFGGGGDDAEQEPPRVASRRRQAAEAKKPTSGDWADERMKWESKHPEWKPFKEDEDSQRSQLQRDSARRFWAAEDEQSGGGGEAAAPPAQDPAAAGGAPPMDPSAMGGMQQPMLPPPGSQAVAPPAPAMPLENQPAEDALLDTANQAIMQMIDQETAEYQQIIDPLSKALQAIQFAQQVEQTEHPMDVTPPQGTVNVDPSQAPGGAQNPMQPTARRRRAYDEHLYHDDEPDWEAMTPRERSMVQERIKNNPPHEGIEYGQPHSASRQAKIRTALRNATRVIAHRYNLSPSGERMLFQAAIDRRGYEHIIEALHLVPVEARKAAAIHMGHLLAAGNARFNKDVFLTAAMSDPRTASNPRDRAGDAWRDGRDRGVAEHGRQDAEDYGDEGPLVGSSEPWQGFGDQGHPQASDVPWSERNRIRGSRHPFDRPRLAGETWQNTPTLDAFEYAGQGEVPRISDNNPYNEMPKLEGAEPHRKGGSRARQAADITKKLQKWMQQQQERGLNYGGDVAAEGFLNTRSKPLGPQATQMVHQTVGAPAHPESEPKAPKVKAPKAVNPVTKKGSFFTRKVSGWKWDDHLSGYLSKEARAFTCACGEKVAAPSYKTCKCGKIWNVYAIGDTHHLASDTADVYIAREIPVRDNVIMANKKLAGPAQKSQRELLAEIDKLADWTKYDDDDPAKTMGKNKPPSTKIPSGDAKWHSRNTDGKYLSPAFPTKKK